MSSTVLSPGLIRLFALACGLTVANLYYAQPLLGELSRDFQVDPAHMGLVITLTQLGYAAGLVLLVPLGDIRESRRLILQVMSAAVVALILASFAPNYHVFCVTSLALGLTATVAQLLVPLAASLAPAERRGQVVGQVMSGLLLGILLARAVSGLLSDHFGWPMVYRLSAVSMTVMVLLLARFLPQRHPQNQHSYPQLLGSLWHIFWQHPPLRQRMVYQFTMMGTFSAFWTAITFYLGDQPFHLSQGEIGIFALIGAAGALCAPWAGRLGDRGYASPATGVALALAAAGFGLTALAPNLWLLAIGAIVLDMAVQATLILGQQTIYSLDSQQANRLNTLYIAGFFLGGALASSLSTVFYSRAGWPGVTALGAGLPLLGLLFWVTVQLKK